MINDDPTYRFKHETRDVIIKCSETLARKLDLDPDKIYMTFHLFPMDFFINTPYVSFIERENWYYFRDSLTHSALIFNYETSEIKLIDEKKYWDDEYLNTKK